MVHIHGLAKTKMVPVEHFEDVTLGTLWGTGQEPHEPDYLAMATLTLVPWQPATLGSCATVGSSDQREAVAVR